MLLALPAWAPPRLAILLVGPRGDKPTPAELELRERVRELLAEVGKPDSKPVRYHFDRPLERKHCEQKLKIKAEDLVFAGVVELDSRGAVVKVVYRYPRAERNLEVAAQETVYQWRRLTGQVGAQD
ncbi:MAG: hypothetical protein AB1758_09905 [Candidatus Eremiobacterota bacterium]